jgi:pimeloyl-ACP methyl ester carboxylesterase
MKQIDAGGLNIGYAEAGTIDGPAVILLHGWQWDIHSLCLGTEVLTGCRSVLPGRQKRQPLGFDEEWRHVWVTRRVRAHTRRSHPM